jgi:type II secretory pathway component GspD/PulD (secretin)/tetratricopeptide (TPR) repeat protein
VFRSAALLAALAGSLLPCAAASGQEGLSGFLIEPAAPTGTVEVRLTEAADLLAAGSVIRAQHMVLDVLGADMGASLSRTERDRATTLHTAIFQRLRQMDPIEVSLQKAERHMAVGELLLAERQASGVMQAASATPMQQAMASSVLGQIESRRVELEVLVPQVLDQAIAAFDAGRLAESTAALKAIQNSGVVLTPEQQIALATYRSKILAVEAGRGGVIGGGVVTTGAMQPGVVNRTPQNVDTQPTGDPLVDEARRVGAQTLRSEADSYYAAGEYARAQEAYNRLLTDYRGFLSVEEITMVEDRLNEIRAVVQQGGQPLTEAERIREIDRQRTEAEFLNLMEQAELALGEGDVDGAGRLASRAEATITANEHLFSQAEVDQYEAQAAAMLQQVEQRREGQIRETAAETEARLRAERENAENRAAAERESQKRELLSRVRALQMEMKYDEALQVVDQILFLDPVDPAALFMHDVILDTKYYRDYNLLRNMQLDSYTGQIMENQPALIAPTSLITFPADWPQISFRRGEPTAYADSPENRRVLASLETTRIPVAFNNNPLENVVTFLESVTQIDMDADWDALEAIGVERGDPVSLNLTSAPVSTVLDRVLAKLTGGDFGDAASWAIQDGVVIISSDEQLRRQTELVIYDIRDLLIEVPDYDNAPDFDLQSVLQSGGGGGGGGQSPFQENDEEEPDRIPLQDRIDRILEIIQQNVDFDGWQVNGGDTGYIQELNGNLIITNTARNHREIAGLLSKLREIRAMQINVESRFLLVNQEFFEQIGFDLDVYFNATSQVVTAARGRDPTIVPSDFFDFETGGYRRVVFGQSQPTAANPAPPNLGQGAIPPDEFTPVASAQNSLGLAQALAGGNFASDILASAPALGIAGQFLDDIQVDFLVRATQADRRSVSLNAPRLTFTNGQRSNIYVATQVSFVSDLQPVVSDSAVGFDPEIDVISEGVVLDVEGTVTGGRRYVTLNITTSVSQLARPFRTQSVTAVAGGQLVNSADTQSFIELPEATVTSVSTTVTVPDQGTILIGGQRLISEFEVETGVPILSKIPILNRFFSNRIESKEEQTLLILIKPTVLIQNEEEENAYPGIGEQMRTMNFGG